MTRKTLERGDFRLLHYAGEVTYCVVGKKEPQSQALKQLNNFYFQLTNSPVTMFIYPLGFLDKNNDLLYRNIKDVSLLFCTL